MDKNLLTLGGVALVAGGAYLYFNSQCKKGDGPEFICDLLGYPAGTPDTKPPTDTAKPPDTTKPPVDLPSTDPWDRAAIAMKTLAGNDSQNIDQWNWMWHNAPAGTGLPTGFGQAGYVTSDLTIRIIALAGGDRTKKISVKQWLTYLRKALQEMGLSGFHIPTWLINKAAFAALPSADPRFTSSRVPMGLIHQRGMYVPGSW